MKKTIVEGVFTLYHQEGGHCASALFVDDKNLELIIAKTLGLRTFDDGVIIDDSVRRPIRLIIEETPHEQK